MIDQRYCPSWAWRFAAILVLEFTRTIVNFSYKFGRLGNRASVYDESCNVPRASNVLA